MRRILLPLAVALAFLAPVSCTPRADAHTYQVPGCHGGAIPKMQQWFPGATVRPFFDITHTERTRFDLYATQHYWLCRNGTHPTKVRFYAFQFCATRESDLAPAYPWNIKGFKYHPWFLTKAGTTINPGQRYMKWSGTGTAQGQPHCSVRQAIAPTDQVWMFLSNKPFWEFSGSVDQNNMKDTHYNFHEGGSLRYYVHPHHDTTLLNPKAAPVAARAAVVTRWEYRRVRVGWTRARTHELFDTSGKVILRFRQHGHRWQERMYPTDFGQWVYVYYRQDRHGVWVLNSKEKTA